MADNVAEIAGRQPDSASERRLNELRAQAQAGTLKDPGVRPAGAPFPVASRTEGYYGVPLLKPPQWTMEVPLYFAVGGAAGAAAVIAAMAEWTDSSPLLARDARRLAAAGAAISPVLLIMDLGRPERFYNMLRVFKPQSAMSVGAWTLFVFSNAAIANAAMDLMEEFTPRIAPRFLHKTVRAVATPVAAATGTVMASYTGVLIGATAIPVWNRNVRTLPVHFAMSGMNGAVAALELAGHNERSLNLLGMGAAAFETIEGANIERSNEAADRPLKHGRSGWVVRVGGVLSGPVPLALRAASLFAGRERARKLRRAAAACSIAGSLLTRFGWIEAGRVSARDYKLPLEIDQRCS